MKNSLKKRYATIEAWLSIVLNILLFGIKYWAGFVSGSVAIIADSWHTLSDSFSSIIVLIGAKLANKPADEKHPFGYGRTEVIASLIVAIFLGFIAVSFLRESIEALFDKNEPVFGKLTIIVTSISMISKELMAQFAIRIGKKVDSLLIIADGKHHRSDALSSFLILVGILFGSYFWWIDAVLGIIVAGFIFYSGYEIISENINHLLGTKPEKILIEKTSNICKQIAGKDIQAHHFHLHDYVNHQELSFHIRLDSKMNLKKAHALTVQIEEKIYKELNIFATIHLEPLES